MNLNVILLEDHSFIAEFYKESISEIKQIKQIDIASSLKEAYKLIIEDAINYDLAILDLSMSAYEEKNLNSGEDLAKLIRKTNSKTKIIFITGFCNSIQLSSIFQNIKPEGFIVKCDINYFEFSSTINNILNGEIYLSKNIIIQKKEILLDNNYFDYYNNQIIMFIHNGIKTKNIPKHLPLTLSAVHKRKQKIKALLKIHAGNDQDIIRECKKIGII